MATDKKLSFEDALEELEKIVLSMEEDELNLEELVSRFERGTKLQRHCSLVLEQVRTRIETLKQSPETDKPADSSSTENDESTDDNDELLF